MTPTPAQLALAAAAGDISGTLDQQQFALAELAADNRAVDDWASVIGRQCGRNPRTIRGWASVADYRRGAVNAPAAPFAFWAVAQKNAQKFKDAGIPEAQMIELMTVALDENVSAEEYAQELAAMLPAPTPDYPARWEAQAAALLGLVDSFGGPVGNHLRRAALALSEAALVARKEAQA